MGRKTKEIEQPAELPFGLSKESVTVQDEDSATSHCSGHPLQLVNVLATHQVGMMAKRMTLVTGISGDPFLFTGESVGFQFKGLFEAFVLKTSRELMSMRGIRPLDRVTENGHQFDMWQIRCNSLRGQWMRHVVGTRLSSNWSSALGS
jgi:hypothetical protein